MVILRIEDPQYEGTRNPAVDPIAYFQVISNVSSSATAIPDGRTGIPLARIDIPASTATITDAMIKDVRKVANPRRERTYGPSPGVPLHRHQRHLRHLLLLHDRRRLEHPHPSWASVAKIRFDIGGLRLSSGAVYGDISATFGASLAIQAVSVDDSQTSGRRYAHLMGDTLTIPPPTAAPPSSCAPAAGASSVTPRRCSSTPAPPSSPT